MNELLIEVEEERSFTNPKGIDLMMRRLNYWQVKASGKEVTAIKMISDELL